MGIIPKERAEEMKRVAQEMGLGFQGFKAGETINLGTRRDQVTGEIVVDKTTVPEGEVGIYLSGREIYNRLGELYKRINNRGGK